MYSINTFTVAGGESDYNITFEGDSPGYIEEEHVFYYIGAVAQAESARTFITSTQVRINPVPVDGTVISFRRHTSPTDLLVDHVSGNPVTEANLDKANLQNLYLNQEIADDASRAYDLADDASEAAEAAEVAQAAAEVAQAGAELSATNAETSEDAAEAAQGLSEDARDESILNAELVLIEHEADGTHVEFQNVANMRASTFTFIDGQIIGLSGYYNKGDGGGQAKGLYWSASSTETDNGVTIFKVASKATGRLKSIDPTNLNMRHAGAKGDNSTDDYAAFVVGIDAGIYNIDEGIYLLSQTIELNTNDQSLYGKSANTTFLEATHSSGPVIHMSARRNSVENITVDSSAARIAGASGSNYGILTEPPDDGSSARYTNIYGCEVNNQPNHGVLFSGPCYETSVKRTRVQYHAGHGVVYDNGTITGRTNKAVPGLAVMETLGIGFCQGNALVVGGKNGQSSNRAIRVTMTNVECAESARDSGVYLYPVQATVYGAEITIKECSFDAGTSGLADADYGLEVAGRNISVLNSRFIHLDVGAVKVENNVEYDTNFVQIKGSYLSKNTGAFDPAVFVSSGCQFVEVEGFNSPGTWPGDVDSLVAKNSQDATLRKCMLIHKNGSESVVNSTTLQDDDELFFEMIRDERRVFKLSLFFDGPSSGDLKFSFAVPSGSDIHFCTRHSLKINTTGSVVAQDVITTAGNTITVGTNGAGVFRHVDIVGWVRTNGTSGNVIFRWAQATANASPTRIMQSSEMRVW